MEAGQREEYTISAFPKAKYLCANNSNPDQLESVREIRFYVTSNSGLADRMRGANQAKMLRLIARRGESLDVRRNVPGP